MKKTIYLLVCALICSIQMFSQTIVEVDYYQNNPELGGDAVIKKSTKAVDGDNATVSFEVEVSTSGAYYVNFWMFPSTLKDGSLANYAVSVNGNVLADKIVPTVGDWQDITLSTGKRISLSKGINTIAVIGKVPDVPNVEHVKLSSQLQEANIDATEYRSYKSAIEKASARNAAQNALVANALSTDTLTASGTSKLSSTAIAATPIAENPLYNYEYYAGLNISYTFYKTVSFTAGQQVLIATSGVNNFAHVVELFSATSPESYSWSAKSNSSCIASINVTIPVAGLYYVRVRSYQNGHSGLCNLNINNQNYYNNVTLYSVGLRCTQPTDQIYNTFTANSTKDPILWIEEGTGTPGKIYTFNDDYSGTGDFNWGSHPRIKRQYTRPVHSVLLSTYASSSPMGKCDLYMRCLHNGAISAFSNLKEDDAIQSSPATSQYNCISWSGGITSYWEWPLSTISSYYSSNPLTAFDNFYASRGLTRTGATESNGVVALWAIVGAGGSRQYTHASVRQGADGNMHGYDWESKTGHNARIFHPRYALSGSTYGIIVEYYIRNTSATSSSMSLEEEIANGSARIEYVNFTSDETAYLSEKMQQINDDVLQQFHTLYDDWKEVTMSTVYSNPDQIADCQEYRDALSFCSSHEELLYVLYDKVGQGEFAAVKLVEDLTFEENASILENVRNGAQKSVTRSGIKTIRPLLSNYTAYVKELLSLDNERLAKAKERYGSETGISYSNFKDIEVSSAQIGFSLDNSSNVTLRLLDLSGNTLSTIVHNVLLNSGSHTYQLPSVDNDVYLVQLIIDGKVNVKKVFNSK